MKTIPVSKKTSLISGGRGGHGSGQVGLVEAVVGVRLSEADGVSACQCAKTWQRRTRRRRVGGSGDMLASFGSEVRGDPLLKVQMTSHTVHRSAAVVILILLRVLQ